MTVTTKCSFVVAIATAKITVGLESQIIDPNLYWTIHIKQEK